MPEIFSLATLAGLGISLLGALIVGWLIIWLTRGQPDR